MNEGMADVFSFIISEDPCLAEYVAKGTGATEKIDGFSCLRKAANETRVNEDFNGESHNDGLPLVGAHWEIYQKMLENGLTKDDFARLFLTALLSVPSSEIGYKEWGELVVKAAEEGAAAALKDDIKKILTDRNYFEEIRARDVTGKAEYFYFGGVGEPMYGLPSTNTVFIEDKDGDIVEVAPMYLQLYYDVPECVDTLTVTGMPYGENSTRLNPDFMVFVREGQPIIWKHIEGDVSTAKYDKIVEGEDNTWTFKNLKPGKRYYFHFINRKYSGLLYGPKAKASWSSKEECTPTEPEPTDPEPTESDDSEVVVPDSDKEENLSDDEEIADDGDTPADDDMYNDDEQKKEKKSSGCSMTLF